MSIQAVLFDLDGTLLPMDQDTFVKAYFGRLARKLAPHGYDPDALIAAIWQGTKAMVKNDGSQSNEQAFWNDFCTRFGEKARLDEPLFDEYYHNEFQQVQTACGFDPAARKAVDAVKEKGLRTALATNPIFPAIATQSRARWAGLDTAEFELYTTYENSCHCKPNLAYYQDILSKMQLQPENCLMVGNDVGEDMVAGKLGMQVYLVTDCLINKTGESIEKYPHGTLEEFAAWVRENL